MRSVCPRTYFPIGRAIVIVDVDEHMLQIVLRPRFGNDRATAEDVLVYHVAHRL